jgi:hypothetical protein
MAELLDKQQLLDRVNARRDIEVSSAQFDDWKRDGLVPAPVSPTLTGRRGKGRPRLLYPDTAVEALVWLGTHRRFIDGVDVAHFWMWMEGFDYVEVDPQAVLLSRIQAAWRMAQGHMPSLPDIAAAAERGIADSERDSALDEFDAHVVEPHITTDTLVEQQSGTASIAAMLFGLLPSALVEGGTADDETFAQGTAGALLTPKRQEWRDTVAAAVPRALEAGKLLELYRLVTEEQFDPTVVRAAWQMLTPDNVRLLGWGLALFRPLSTQDIGRLRDRADLMRLLRYDPLLPLAIAAVMADVAQALQGSGQGPGEQSGKEITTS